jgi:hypothetical protein
MYQPTVMKWLRQFDQNPDGLYHDLDDANFQNYSTVQSKLQPTPKTLASAATIAPTTFLTDVTGTVPVTTITPPVSGTHMLAFRFVTASPGVTGTTGNIGISTTTVLNRILLLVWDPTTAKYYPTY